MFSFTAQGTTWRTQSWLAELLYSSAESVTSSLAWANWLVLGVAGITVLFIGLAVYRNVPSPITGSAVLLLMVWLLGPLLQPRPVIFSFALIAALVVVLQHRDRVGWLVIPIIWVWAGVHGSWVIGGFLVLLEWIRTSDRNLFKVGMVALASTLATAHGLGTWQILLDFFGSQEALRQMQEWKPPDFGGIAQMPYVALIVGVIVGAVRGKIRMRDLVVVVPFMFLGLTSRRLSRGGRLERRSGFPLPLLREISMQLARGCRRYPDLLSGQLQHTRPTANQRGSGFLGLGDRETGSLRLTPLQRRSKPQVPPRSLLYRPHLGSWS